MEATPLLEIRGLEKEYPGVRALQGVDFDVRAGEVHCVVGPNGAGKSTLIKCVSGAVEPTSGQVLLEGEPLAAGSPSAAIDRGIATIYQELDLVEDLSVAQNVFLGHEPRRARLLDLGTMRSDTAAILKRLDHEGISPRAFVRDLRPAARQVVSIARALSRKVRLLIMDEPSAILDDGEIETMFGVVRRLTAEGVGVIYISHRLDEIKRLGDRVTVLTDGRTVASGLPASTSVDELVELMVGRKVDQLYPDRATGSETVLLEVRDLTRLPDVRDVSFDVRAGEVLGIGGLVGAGRSELLRAVYGVDGRDSGEVRVAGRAARGRAARQGDRRRPGARARGPQVPGPPDGVEPGEECEPGQSRPVPPPAAPEPRAEREVTGRQLEALNTVPADVERVVAELSGGNQQKVVLARWLLRECRVLLLDEPTRGVDVATKAELYRVIIDLAARGLGVVVVSSELDELAGICTRVLVMQEGKLVAEVAGEETSELDLLRHAVTASGQAEYRDEIAQEAA